MDKRSYLRVQTGEDVLFVTHNVMMRGRMGNLSVGGCRIGAEKLTADCGEKVEITLLQGVTVAGRIAWREEGAIGVHFDRPLGDATVRYFRIGEWEAKPEHKAVDGFGRILPPLGLEPRRRAGGAQS